MNKFLEEFKDRGLFYQCTNEEELSKLLDKQKINGYIGFDCTAESLHVESLLQIKCLRLRQALSMCLSERINWIISTIPHWISKILFVYGSYEF